MPICHEIVSILSSAALPGHSLRRSFALPCASTRCIILSSELPSPGYLYIPTNSIPYVIRTRKATSLEDCAREDELRDEDGGALERDGGPGVVAEVVELHDFGIHNEREDGEDAFKVGEEGRVVERPLGGGLFGVWCVLVSALFLGAGLSGRWAHVKVPLGQRERIGDGEPAWK